MDFFLSDHDGFTGTIKNHAQDFVVTEIDLDGRLVNTRVDDDDGPRKPPDETIQEKAQIKTINPCDHRDPTSPTVTPELGDLLDPAVYEDLEGFFTKTTRNDTPDMGRDEVQKSLHTQSELLRFVGSSPGTPSDLRSLGTPSEVRSVGSSLGSPGTEVRPVGSSRETLDLLSLGTPSELRPVGSSRDTPGTEVRPVGPSRDTPSDMLSLGSFPDKHQRMLVHRAVRHHFPSLMTVTRGERGEIAVRENPDHRELAALVTRAECDDFFRFVDAKAPGSSYTFRPDGAKENRTAVHHFLSRRFGKLVETKSFKTTDGRDQGGPAISVRLRSRKRTGKEEVEEEEVYTAFTLRKENLETLEAISYLATSLGAVPADFSYAGVKDKRAVTHQAMVVRGVTVQRLTERGAELQRRGLLVTRARPARGPLHLGRLAGNRFDLVVRHVRAPSGGGGGDGGGVGGVAAAVERAVQNVKARGFVNYYGPQRFGTAQSVQSDRVGLALLKGDMVGAVRLFFTPEAGDEPHNRAKRHFLQTGNAKESLALMPVSKARERLMLRALHRYGPPGGGATEGSTRAWLSLPHAMRVFYPHAYCSRVWNEAVAHRLATLGHAPRQGDLVWQKQQDTVQEDAGESNLRQIHVVSAEEEEAGVYTLTQVVLPMPGNTVTYPQNAMAPWYRERLAGDGLADARFRVPSLKLNLPGCYRPLVSTPRNFTHRLLLPEEEEEKEEEEEGSEETRKRDNAEALPSLVLNFDLASSSYATVCLREMMKCDV